MGGVRNSLLLSSVNSWATVVFQIISTAILARILTPEETGIFAVAAVFASLASSFRDFGVGEYLIQERELDDNAFRAALTVNIAVSWLVCVLLFTFAPAMGRFYDAPGITDVMRVQALNFLLIPFGAVTMAWFRREMQFMPIVVVGLAANSVSFVVSIVLALKGAGYMSLAWSSLAGVVVTVVGAIIARPPHLPRWPGLKGVGKVVEFGRFASGIYLFAQLGKGAPEMVIGRALDMASVGIFSRAAGLVEVFHRLVLRSVLPVCLPYFAKSVREEGTPTRGLLLTMSYLTVIGWPFMGFMAITSYAAIRILYGPQWTGAVALAQVLCAAAAVEVLYCAAREAMLSLGKARESQNLQILIEVSRISGLMLVIPFGLQGACWGLLVAAGLGAVAAHRALRQAMDLRFKQVVTAALPSLQVSIAALLPVLALTLWQPITEENYLWVGLTGGIATAIAWVVALGTLKHPLWYELLPVIRKKLTLVRRPGARGSD